ncbi:MAG: S8 family serine peptidase [Terriglobales bacterium]
MLKRRRAANSLVVWSFLLIAPVAFAQAGAKKKVMSQADLPRFSYPVDGSASQLVQADDATFNAFAMRVRADLDTIFRDYEIDDKSTMRTLLGAKLDLQEIAGENEDALKTVEALRALEEKPSAKLTTGVFTRSALQAAIDTKTTSGPAFDRAFTEHYREAINSLPWDVVQDSVKSSYRSSRIYTKSVAVGEVETELDPAVKKSGALDNLEAWELVSVRNDLKSAIPLDTQRGEVLKQYIAAHNVVKPDMWAAREVTLTKDQKLSPVLVAIWDSGIDVSLFRGQLFTDPRPTTSGTHGLAFDDRGGPSASWLYPLTSEQQKEYPEWRSLIQGLLDIENGIDSPDADAVQKRVSTFSPEQMHQIFEFDKVFGFYAHGTHCAGIAVRGNPAARLVVARFNDQLPDLPFPPTDEWARHLGADFQQMSDYFRTRKVRVVNMSWGDEPQEFETWISKTGGGADPAERKKRAAELYAIWRDAIKTAIQNAPDTLFITAAGNSDSNAGFTEDVPASLHLPNLIAVGAVNQAGDETSFTSYGDTVVVDADGYNVESFVPGGARLKLSGTSMASPNVVNLAAKLFALDPSLTPAQVIKLIRSGATTSEDERRHLIDEKRSVALLQARAKE